MLQDLVSVHLRHHDVEDHQVEALRFDNLQRLPSVCGHSNGVPLALNMAGKQVAVHLVVVNYEQGAPLGCHSGIALLQRTDGAHNVLDHGACFGSFRLRFHYACFAF